MFKAVIKNLTSHHIDSFYLASDLFINNEPRAFQKSLFTTMQLNDALKPSEKRAVEFTVSTSTGVASSFVDTNAWKKASKIRLHIRPKSYTDGRGIKRNVVDDNSFFNEGKNPNKKLILWDEYIKETQSIRNNSEYLVKSEKTLQQLISELAKLKKIAVSIK